MYKLGLEVLKLAEKQKGCETNEKYKNMLETKEKVKERLNSLKGSSPQICNEKNESKILLKENVGSISFVTFEFLFGLIFLLL